MRRVRVIKSKNVYTLREKSIHEKIRERAVKYWTDTEQITEYEVIYDSKHYSPWRVSKGFVWAPPRGNCGDYVISQKGTETVVSFYGLFTADAAIEHAQFILALHEFDE